MSEANTASGNLGASALPEQAKRKGRVKGGIVFVPSADKFRETYVQDDLQDTHGGKLSCTHPFTKDSLQVSADQPQKTSQPKWINNLEHQAVNPYPVERQ